MQSFLCRIMAFIFALNCLLPAPAVWAQPAAGKDLSAQIQQRVTHTVSQQLEESVALAIEELQNAEGVDELKQAVINLHEVMDKKYAAQQQEEKKRLLEKDMQQPYVIQRSSTYVAPKVNPYAVKTLEQNEVLARLAKDELTIDDMINYIDPFDPAQYNLQNIIYASEILGNSLDAFLMQPDEFTIMELNSIILLAQLRALYRLNKLTKQNYSSIYEVMAAGSLRIAFWKMHNFYVQTGQEDPLLAPKSNNFSQGVSFLPNPSGLKDGNPSFFAPSYSYQQGNSALPENIFEKINNQFLSELSALKAKKPKEGTQEYQLLLALADYATVYAMLVNPTKVQDIVKVLDEGPKRSLTGKVVAGDFKQTYSAVLNAVFTAVFESVKYMTPNTGTWEKTLSMLADFSNPEKYSVPTRVFALEAASLMYSSSEACPQVSAAYPIFIRCNSGNEQNDDRRALFAQRTVDLYAPLTKTHFAAIEDYGLDSKQMQLLADKLAYIYNGFANDELKMDTSRPRMKNSYVLDQGADGKTLILNGKNSIPRLLPLNRGQQFQLPDGSLKTISGFGRMSNGNWVEMQLKNGLNSKKVSDEFNAKFAVFVGNAIFWIYGGEIFTFIGTAYRSTKGAMMVLPKAVKAAATANKGRRAMSFGIEIQKGVRFANLQKNLAKSGATLVAERVAEKSVKNPKLPVKATYQPETVSSVQVISSQHALKGQYSKWNPKRWIGKEPPQITRFSFQQVTPGFGISQGTAEVTGTSLSQGVRNWDDWRKLRSSFQSIQDPTQHAFPQFFNFVERKAMYQELALRQAMEEAGKNGAFNAWVPIKTPVYGTGAVAEGETITWWNTTRLGKPGNKLATDEINKIILTPSISRQAALSATDPTKLANAVELYPEQLIQNNWQQTLIQHYFKEVERKGISKYLLPKYVPNANYWQAASSNWRFALPAGKALAANTRFWKGFKANVIFFGAWAGLDMITYSPMKLWIASAAQKDQEKEMKKHGDAFDPQKLEEDNKAAEEEKKAIVEAGGTVKEQTLTTYNEMAGTQKESSEGALLVFPILSARHSLPEGFGNLNFVSEQDQALFQQMAARIQLNRAMRQQNKTRQEKSLEMEKEMRKNMRLIFAEQIEADQKVFEEFFFYQNGLKAKQEITVLFKDYKAQIMKELDSQDSLEKQYAKISRLQEEMNQKLQKKIDEANRMNELLMEQQEQTISEEEYIPSYDDEMEPGEIY